jgi:predicted aspartyl protease
MAHSSARYLRYVPARRLAAKRVAASAVALLPVASCVLVPKPLVITAPTVVEASRPDAKEAPHAAVQFYDNFWRALEDINLQAAWISAGSGEQRRLADAIDDFLGGRYVEADSIIIPLLTANDGEVRNAARITYGAILTAQGNWSRLATYADSASREPHDAAGVEAWAPAFKGVSTTVAFMDTMSLAPLSRSRSGVAIIPVSVNGVTRHFWLDTGSSLTVLTSEVAAVSGVTGIGGDTLELVTSVGRLPTQAAVIQSLKLGGVAVTNARAMIVNGAALQLRETANDAFPQAIDGVIGFDLIRLLDLSIDDNHGRVIIRKPSLGRAGANRSHNLTWFGVPIVTLLSENGSAVHLVLDTGAEETFGTPGMARKSGARWRRAERRTVQGFGGSASESGIVIPSVRLFLGDVPLTFKRIFLYEARYPTIFTLDGTLGADVGRGGVVRIDMTNGRFDVSAK